jgi:hypothetical protein
MPIGRYSLFVGSALLSLLYLADWSVPRLAAEPAHSELDRTIIRIHSEHRWPTAVAIDTNFKPINSPTRDDFPSSPADSPKTNRKNEAFAYASTLSTLALPIPNRFVSAYGAANARHVPADTTPRVAKAPASRIDTWVAGRRGFRRSLPGRVSFLPVTRTGRIIIDAASPLIHPGRRSN